MFYVLARSEVVATHSGPVQACATISSVVLESERSESAFCHVNSKLILRDSSLGDRRFAKTEKREDEIASTLKQTVAVRFSVRDNCNRAVVGR